jgi:NAD(P)-dependent dehydrogenase (short-subunit alcohol dehydrogenase family)
MDEGIVIYVRPSPLYKMTVSCETFHVPGNAWISSIAEGPDRFWQHVPLGCLGVIRDIEAAAIFLCSDAANYFNGAVLVVDGGHWLAANRML